MENWNNTRITPEEIVARLGNISNRSDIRETQELQVKEIKEYAAKELENIANGLVHMADLDKEDKVYNFTVNEIANIIYRKASSIREGK